jgi:hypothetical protein
MENLKKVVMKLSWLNKLRNFVTEVLDFEAHDSNNRYSASELLYGEALPEDRRFRLFPLNAWKQILPLH